MMPSDTANEGTQEIMTLSETAQYLKLAEKTVHRMIRKGTIPCAKVASQWRFSRSMIDDWLFSQMKVVPRNDLETLIQQEGDMVPLSRFITPSNILPDLSGNTPEEVLAEMTSHLGRVGQLPSPNEFLQGLCRRESMVSTGIGRGIALPHQRNTADNPSGNPCIILGRHTRGIDYRALDGGLTHLFFLLVTNSEVIHLRLMAKISSLFRRGNLLEPLLEAPDSHALAEALIREEQRLLHPQDTGPPAAQGGNYDPE